MALNQNYPVVEDAWAPAYNAVGAFIPSAKWVDLTARTQVGTSIKRGKQYELDAIQSGTYDTTLGNEDGALDPVNTAGPYAGRILPYQPIRHRVQWYPTANRLPQTVATGGEGYSAGLIPASFGITSATDSTGGSIVALGSGVAFEESNAFQFAVPAASAAFATVAAVDAGAVAGGTTYTFSVYVRNITPGVSVTITPGLGWYGATAVNSTAGPSTWATSTPTTLVGSSTAAWTRITITGTAPSAVYGALVNIALTSAGQASACTLQVDGAQWEIGAAATTWVYPGTWYPLFNGFTERWPSQWVDGGTRGQVVPTGVDSLALLSQVTLSDPLTHELTLDAPRFLYRLDDPQGSTVFADATGANPPLTVGKAKTGGAVYAAGTAITATDPVNGVFVGAGSVLTITNTNPGTSTTTGGASFLEMDGSGIRGLGTTTSTRVVAFRYTGPTPTSTACLWSMQDAYGYNINVGVDVTGEFAINGVPSPGSPLNVVVSGTNLLDGNWHLLAAVAVPFDHINQIPGGYNFYLDGVAAGNSVGYGLMANVVSDVYGTSLDAVGGGVAKYNWKGDIAYVAEFPTTLTTTQITNLYSAWKSACAGESTDARYARILRYAGFTGTTWLSAGLTRSMGPATDIEGTDALSALQSVVDTESGQHHVRATGTVRFMSRGDRYNAFVPTVTFGDGPGEYPYEDLALDFDPTHLANQVTVTQTSTGQKFAATDATSVQNYFPRILARSVNSTNALECQDAANYLLSRFKAPLTRVTSLKVHPAAVPALWPVVAGLDLGARIRVMRRPFGAPTIQVDCFVEQLQWDFDDKGDAWLTMECSAADTTPYGLFSAWHTTVNTTFAAGATSMVVNASADNTNPLASQLGVGQQLMIGQGTARQQTVTVTGVGATSPGWTTATVKFAATALGGNAGDVVSEVLPSGVTDPTTWDAVSKFDSSAFSY